MLSDILLFRVDMLSVFMLVLLSTIILRICLIFQVLLHCHMKQGCQMSKYPTGYPMSLVSPHPSPYLSLW
jgi:hypothetical protein